MAKRKLTQKDFSEIFKAIPHLIKLPARKIWVDYDKEADVLYISLQRPQNATDSEMQEDGVLLRYRDKDLVGITIFEASKR
jgi:uncharacterized protein YuzE